jgi:TolB-like protein
MYVIKKFLLISSLFVLWAGVLPAQQLNLREVIIRSARGVEDVLPQGTMVAVLNFASPSATFTDYVIEELTGELVTGKKVAIVDRQNLALISKEMNLQLSGDVSDESAQAIGKMLGAQSIISGTLTDMGRFYRFRIRVINVETARIQTQVSLDLRKDEQVAYLLSDSQESASRQRPARSRQSDKAANARNNWVSVEAGLLASLGPRYERMLGSQISLGINAYWAPMTPTNVIYSDITYDVRYGYGIDASFRYYPSGRTFFLGASLGYFYYYEDGAPPGYNANSTTHNVSYYVWRHYGVTITPEIGWKIDVGNAGGFFMHFGIAAPFVFGKSYNGDYASSSGLVGMGSRFIYMGAGYAF